LYEYIREAGVLFSIFLLSQQFAGERQGEKGNSIFNFFHYDAAITSDDIRIKNA